MLKINKKILQKEMVYDNTVIFTYYIEYLQIVSHYMTKSMQKFNTYNRQLALEIRDKSENELYRQAIETYRYNQENGYPVMVYEVYRTYEVTYNQNNILSLYFDEYIFTGGAHGNIIRSSQNWNFNIGKMIKLSDLYKEEPYFILNILRQIEREILENPEIYFDDACCLLIDTFNPNSFFITQNGIVIYFQQYDIAPYSSGIREFLIKR